MVEYNDGSVLSQMGASDMRTPIANILFYPERLSTPGNKLNLNDISSLTFVKKNDERFPALPLAYESLRAGLYHSITLNAANEIAVEGFLNGKMGFGEIINCIRYALDSITEQNILTLDDVLMLDKQVRVTTRNYLESGLTKRTVSQI
jgi:1-deoxy-D-xylulose-5-phosphate reductoisomerase